MPIAFSRCFSMPSSCTFNIPPIAALLRKYLESNWVIIDPFARDSKFGTLTNDLDPQTSASYHLPAEKFVESLGDTPKADAVLFDPPYSPRQIAEMYKQIGRPCSTEDTQNARLYKTVRDGLHRVLKPGGIAISCGWNSAGFGAGRNYDMLEILLVHHGGAHNDTIVTVERKLCNGGG